MISSKLTKIKICKIHDETNFKLELKGVWICIECSKNNKKRYVENDPERTIRQKKAWYLKNRDKILKQHKLERELFPDKVKEKKKNHYINRCDHIKEKIKDYRDNLKLTVFSYYSNGLPKCLTCGITELNKLALDHKNNDGAEHRRKIGYKGGNWIYLWVRRNNFPPIFQILCHNCNIKKNISLKPNLTGRSLIQAVTRKKLKEKVFLAYSDSNNIRCVFCLENDISVLTIDHINGGGVEHCKIINRKPGDSFYRWLKNSGFPEGYQVLCFNCNMAKGTS